MLNSQQVLANVRRWRIQHGLIKNPVKPITKAEALPKIEPNTIRLSQNCIVLDIDPNTGEVQVPQ